MTKQKENKLRMTQKKEHKRKKGKNTKEQTNTKSETKVHFINRNPVMVSYMTPPSRVAAVKVA